MKDISALPGDILATSLQMERGARRILRDVSRSIHLAAVYSTPVDTGRARSNWQVSTGAPINHSIFPYHPGKYLWITETANAEAAISQGRQATEDLQKANEVFIVNNVLYVWDLNHGSSTQSAGLFVERALNDGHMTAAKMRVFE
jgi:hypothetical protein